MQPLGVLAAATPHSVEAWCAAVADRRQRPITVVPVTVPPGGPSGLLLRRDDEDVIAVADDAAPLLRGHIVLHELAHLWLGHEQLDDEIAHVNINGARSAQEREAEQYAEQMAEWAIAPRRHRCAAATAVRQHPGWLTAGLRLPGTPRRCRPGRLRDFVAGAAARHALYSELHSLWLPLTVATPRIAPPLLNPELDRQPPISRTWAALRRRVVQIYDGLWHLRGHLDHDVYDAARHRARRFGLDERSADIEGHAATIAVAIRTPSPVASTPPMQSLAGFGSDDVDTDAARLAAVAHAIRRSPFVEATIATHYSEAPRTL